MNTRRGSSNASYLPGNTKRPRDEESRSHERSKRQNSSYTTVTQLSSNSNMESSQLGTGSASSTENFSRNYSLDQSTAGPSANPASISSSAQFPRMSLLTQSSSDAPMEMRSRGLDEDDMQMMHGIWAHGKDLHFFAHQQLQLALDKMGPTDLLRIVHTKDYKNVPRNQLNNHSVITNTQNNQLSGYDWRYMTRTEGEFIYKGEPWVPIDPNTCKTKNVAL